MSEPPKALILDLVEWLAAKPRPLADVLDVWRTSCPRLTVWEDALDRGLVSRQSLVGGMLLVAPTEKGLALLRAEGRVG
jgi:hypothetical protein